MKLTATLILLLTNFVWANAELPSIGKNLYQHIYQGHLFTHPDSKFVGGWETKVYFKESFNLLSLQENSFFVPIFIMQSLDDLNSSYMLPGYSRLQASFKNYVEGFLNEARANGEPDGTINYWRSYPLPSNPSENHYYPLDPNQFNIVEHIILNLRNIPNDLDGSAQLCDWLIRSSHPQARQYCLSMVELLSTPTYVDTSSRTQSVFDDKWKKPGSGAYLTWASTDQDRIPYNANDVDCVVNLNILNGFNSIAKAYSEAELSTVNNNIADVCTMVRKVVSDNSAHLCSPYYDGTSFYWAFSKNYKNELTKECLEPVAEIVRNRTIKKILEINKSVSKRLILRTPYLPSKIDRVDIGEILLTALNLDLHKHPRHGLAITKAMKRILNVLLTQEDYGNKGIKEGFAFRGIIHLRKESGIGKLTGLWKSSYLSSVLILEAYMRFFSL